MFNTYIVHCGDREGGAEIGSVELALVLMLEQHWIVEDALPLATKDDHTL